MIPRRPIRREARIPRSPRWILIFLITLAPVVATVDFVSLSASARSSARAVSERMTSGNWIGRQIAATPGRPETERPDAGRDSHDTQWTFLREMGAKVAALVHVRTALSVPSVVGPTGGPIGAPINAPTGAWHR